MITYGVDTYKVHGTQIIYLIHHISTQSQTD